MRALVLAGGAAKGSYASGSLLYLLGELAINYSIICGVSIGAINGAFLSQFCVGQEKLSAIKLSEMWKNIRAEDVYKHWKPFGRLQGFFKSSIYDSSPLHNLIKSNLDINKIRDSGKHLSIGTVSLSSGKYTIFDQSSDHLIDAVIASSAVPGILTPIKFLGQLWSDGGIKVLSPIKTAIDLGADIIDVIMTSPETRIKHFIENPTTIDIIKRSFDLSTDKIMSNDIEKANMYNMLASAGFSDKKVIKINIIRPQFNLIEDLLNFDPIKIKGMIDKGYEDAKNFYNNFDNPMI